MNNACENKCWADCIKLRVTRQSLCDRDCFFGAGSLNILQKICNKYTFQRQEAMSRCPVVKENSMDDWTLTTLFALAFHHWHLWPQRFKAILFFFNKLNTSFFVHHPPYAIGWPLTLQLAAPFLFPAGCDEVSSHPGLCWANTQWVGRQRSIS